VWHAVGCRAPEPGAGPGTKGYDRLKWGQPHERTQRVQVGDFDGLWRCCKATIVRVGFQLQSKEIKDAGVSVGSIVEELESRRNENGQLRIKVKLKNGVGWISEKTKDGQVRVRLGLRVSWRL
jgi:hypothetical protein